LVKRASDLLNPFIGMTEMLIARMFRDAERDGSILLLDEADSLLRDRNNAYRSWEITQTNELLTQMENFKGIMIACTNVLSVMDKAVLRRFSWKVKFLPLDTNQRIRLFNVWFPLADLDTNSMCMLEQIALLSPGDYKAVAKRAMPDKRNQAHYLVEELKVEASYRTNETDSKPKVGFGV